MVPCLRLSSSSTTTNTYASPPALQGNFFDDTPISSVQPSPTVSLTHEYNLAVQTNSYSEIWSTIHHHSHSVENIETGQVQLLEESQLLEQVLQPSHEFVLEALSKIKPSDLTALVADYFKHSESTSRLCLSIHRSVHHAKLIYAPLSELLDILPVDLAAGTYSLTQSQCDNAFDIFLKFDHFDNPFPNPGNYNFNDMRSCFSRLRQQLDHRLRKLRSKMKLIQHATRGSAICLVATVVGVIISAVTIATHALVALVAIPFCPTCPACPASKMTRKQLSHIAQLDAAAMGTFVLHNDLDTIDRLVARLHSAFESDKLLVRLGLERGRDRLSVQEVLKQLQKSHSNILKQLTDLDEHLCLCFTSINRARSLLLREILIN